MTGLIDCWTKSDAMNFEHLHEPVVVGDEHEGYDGDDDEPSSTKQTDEYPGELDCDDNYHSIHWLLTRSRLNDDLDSKMMKKKS
jgi:hypothetical protein